VVGATGAIGEFHEEDALQMAETGGFHAAAGHGAARLDDHPHDEIPPGRGERAPRGLPFAQDHRREDRHQHDPHERHRQSDMADFEQPERLGAALLQEAGHDQIGGGADRRCDATEDHREGQGHQEARRGDPA